MLETSFHQQEIRRAILRLPEDQQKVVILRFIEGFDNREIASATGKSEGAIRVILHRGLAGLRRLLEEKV